MASSIQILRSTTAKERPFPGNLLEGQPALNVNAVEPGLFFKATDGTIFKAGPAAITSDGTPPNTGGVGQQGNCVGELWLDKSQLVPVLKVFDGTFWVDAGSGGGGGGSYQILRRWTKTAVGGETTLSGPDDSSPPDILSYITGLEQVFVNGVLLTEGVDYYTPNSSLITGLVPLAIADEVTVFCWVTFDPLGPIDGNLLIDLSIDTAKLADGAVTSTKIENGTISDTDINANAGILADKLSYTNRTSVFSRTVKSRLQDFVSVLDFIDPALHSSIYNGTCLDDLSVQIQSAISFSNSAVYFPSGTYYCNVFMGNRIVYGDGNQSSRLIPYNTAIAALTIVISPPYWSSHKEIRCLGFLGNGTMVGTGVAFGITDPMEINVDAGATSYDPQGALGTFGSPAVQFPQSVKFYGCQFMFLDKGINWSSGNIGSEVFSCGFQNNRYGVYMLNNKRGGDGMQAGCKYFYGGEMSSNICAIYMHNSGVVNGNISFRDFVLEYNKIAIYSYNSGGMICPFTVENLWQEGNGSFIGGTVTIDSWVPHPTLAGIDNRTTQTVNATTIIIDGVDGEYVFKESFIGDTNLKATDAQIKIIGCRVEGGTGCSGGALNVVNPTTSSIVIKDSWTDCGSNSIAGVYDYGMKMGREINNSATGGAYALNGAPHRASISNVYPNNRVYSYDFSTPQVIAGSYSITGSVVADGLLFSTCNEFTSSGLFGFNQYLALAGSNFTTSAGYYVTTFSAKNVQGTTRFAMWDRNQNQWFNPTGAQNTQGMWVTYASYAYSPGGQGLFFDMSGTNQNCTWRLGELQLLRFDTEQQAINFLSSLAFSYV